MSLLTACQAVVKETGIGEVPSTIISNTDKTAIQLNYLAERAADSLAELNWQAMLRLHTITTVNGTEGYSLPTDWARYIGDTAWDTTNYWPMRGSLDPMTWRAYKNGIVSPSMRRKFRVFGNQVLIFPVPSSADSLTIEYVRNTPWVNGSTYRAAATNDADTTVFPEKLLELDLKWRWLKAKGMDYEEEKREAERARDVAYAQDTPPPTLNFGYATNQTPSFVANIPQQV